MLLRSHYWTSVIVRVGSRFNRALEALWVYALSCYLSHIIKHYETKLEGKKTIDPILGGATGAPPPPLDPPLRFEYLPYVICALYWGANHNEKTTF